jgi:hypothetical protein
MQSKIHGFDSRSIIIQEYPTTINTKRGSQFRLHCLFAPLTYSVRGEIGLGIAFLINPNPNMIGEGRTILFRIKERHNHLQAQSIYRR